MNGNDVGSPGRHSQCLALVGFVLHVGLCGFPEAARCDNVQISLCQHSRYCATLDGYELVSPRFQWVYHMPSGCISKHPSLHTIWANYPKIEFILAISE